MLEFFSPTYMPINIDGISTAQKQSAKFKLAYADMTFQLTRKDFIPVLCAHEAAHLFYFVQAGLQEYDPMPPTIRYDPKTDDYIGHLAAVQLKDLPMWKPGEFWIWFDRISRGHAAGGVIARKMRPHGDTGDQDDKERFKLICEQFKPRSKHHNQF